MTHFLVLRLEKLVRTERKITDQIIKTLIEIEEQKIHLKMGYGSIFTLLVQHLGYSESAAQRRNVAMKLYKKAPEISEKLQDGSLNLTQIAELERVTRQIPTEQILEVIPKIENKNTHQTQHIIAKEFDLPAIQHEKTRTQKDESVRMQITLTKEQYGIFKQAEDLLSHVKPGATHAEVITMLAQKFVKQKLGKDFDTKNTAATEVNSVEFRNQIATAATEVNIQREHSNLTNESLATSIAATEVITQTKHSKKSIESTTTTNVATEVRSQEAQAAFIADNTEKSNLKFKRKSISIKTKRILLKKAQHQCEYTSPTGQRCQAHSLLEIDHIHPVSLGGKNETKNLRIYCRAHNQARADKLSLGLS